MLNGSSQPSNEPLSESARAWYKELNGYHWFVLIVCTLGWLFDCLDQQLFNLARKPAVTDLVGLAPTDPRADLYGGYATSILLLGWATGGIIFGILGDKIGRKRTMIFTILSYSVFTGLSGAAFSIWDFLAYRFIAGLGVGGQFAVGVSLVAESLPNRARPHALGMLQAFSAIGNVGGGLISLVLFQMAENGVIGSAWRWMFLVGVLPAILTIFVMTKLREPEAWLKAQQERKSGAATGSIVELFGDARWRRNTIVGMILASAGVIGLWAIGVFSNDLTQSIFRKTYQQEFREKGHAELDLQFAIAAAHGQFSLDELKQVAPTSFLGRTSNNDKNGHIADHNAQRIYAATLALASAGQTVSPDAVLQAIQNEQSAGNTVDSATLDELRTELAATPTDVVAAKEIGRIADRLKWINARVGSWASITLMLFNVGAFFGIYAFARVTNRLGRRATFAIFFIVAMATTIFAFLCMTTPTDLYWMVPLMGFGQLSVFGGYAIYFPELFPTRLRSTGTSFCYNIARFVAVPGPAVMTGMSAMFFGTTAEPMRYAGALMTCCYLIGIVTLLFAPETKDQPLPE